MNVNWTHKFDSAKGDLPPDVLDCPTCGVMETGNHVHVLLHCPKTELVWDQAITLASEAAVAPPAEQRYLLGGMSMEGRVGHLLRCKVLVDMHTEAPLGGAATHVWLVV